MKKPKIKQLRKERNFMDFQKALTSIKNGKKITRKSWGNRELFLCLLGGFLMVYLTDKEYHPCLLSEIDILASDWEVITDA
jgi:hypothetical protein